MFKLKMNLGTELVDFFRQNSTRNAFWV